MNKGDRVACSGGVDSCNASSCCEAKATCDTYGSCTGATPLNKGSGVECTSNAASCNSRTCCEARGTCDSFDCSGNLSLSVNKGARVSCSGNTASCDASTCCQSEALPCVTIGNAGSGPDNPCMFPYMHDYYEYNACTNAGHPNFWCAITVKASGQVELWGECSPACPQVPAPPPRPVVNVDWKIPVNPQAITVDVGTLVVFSWSGSHNVYERSDDTCNTFRAERVGTSIPQTSPLTVVMATPGTKYYLCTRPMHCSLGMKLAVTVVEARRLDRPQNSVISGAQEPRKDMVRFLFMTIIICRVRGLL